MNVRLDSETEKLVEQEIRSGKFRDATALVGAAVKHFLIAREFGEKYTRQEIEEKIARGLSQLDRSEGVDGDEGFLSLTFCQAQNETSRGVSAGSETAESTRRFN